MQENHSKSYNVSKEVVYLLVLINVFLVFKTLWTYKEYISLQINEQKYWQQIFPPLSTVETRMHLAKIFPELTDIEQYLTGRYIKYEIYKKDIKVGKAFLIQEDIICPVCKDVRYFVGLDLKNHIKSIILINSFHFYGEPMDLKIQNDFLAQFIDKNPGRLQDFKQNIDGITGATKTVSSFLDGLKFVQKHLNES